MTKVYLNSLFFNLSLTAKGIIMFFALSLSNINELDSQNKFKVVIDAGHGGKDPGRPNQSGIKEKTSY